MNSMFMDIRTLVYGIPFLQIARELPCMPGTAILAPPVHDVVGIDAARVLVGNEVVEKGVVADEAPLQMIVVVGKYGWNNGCFNHKSMR